ncbi:MAG: hypothetical protein R3B06_32245 [Kofleriaceae bacterium]
MTFAARFRQGASIGALGGGVAGLVHATVAIGPRLATSALLGGAAGLVAGALWLAHRARDAVVVVE